MHLKVSEALSELTYDPKSASPYFYIHVDGIVAVYLSKMAATVAGSN